jgi:hypothetical protein
MSNELIATQGMSIAEMMGIPSGGGSSPTSNLARMSVLNDPIMGVIEVNGKKVKTEVVPGTSFKITLGEDNVVYSDTITVRTFAIRQRWSKWDQNNNTFIKSVMANELKNDLKDTNGGFNCGRPAGFIKDYNSLPEATKEAMKKSRRTQVLLGTMRINNPVGADGAPVAGHEEAWYPFVYEMKSAESIKAINEANSKAFKKNLKPLTYTLLLTGVERTADSGKAYAVLEAEIGGDHDVLDTDMNTLQDFVAWITNQNEYVIGQWAEKHNPPLSSEDEELVGGFIDIEVAS